MIFWQSFEHSSDLDKLKQNSDRTPPPPPPQPSSIPPLPKINFFRLKSFCMIFFLFRYTEGQQPHVPEDDWLWGCERGGHQHQGAPHCLQCQGAYDRHSKCCTLLLKRMEIFLEFRGLVKSWLGLSEWSGVFFCCCFCWGFFRCYVHTPTNALAHAHARTHARTYTCTHTHTHSYARRNVHTHTYTLTLTLTHTLTHTHTHMCARTHMRMHTHTHTHACTCTHAHTCMHTLTKTSSQLRTAAVEGT